MAKSKAKKMNATAEKPALKPVRLQLPEPDYDRLEKQAKKRGLNLASYARQAVLEKIMADEGGSK
jgi:predicted DNA binding CopG/RHH family protein